MRFPNVQEIEALHKKYAPSDFAYGLVYTHCRIVRDIAMQLITNGALPVDVELVKAGCLLHDIGVYPLLDAEGKVLKDVNYITHGTVGESILKDEGFPEVIWRFASHHTGVGLSKQDIISQNLPLPVENYLADSIEEELVMYADKFQSKTLPPVFNSFDWYKQHTAQFGEDKAIKFEEMAQRFGMPDLEPLSKKYEYEIRL